ncbi:unnamed protein product [Vitrella brassicaformis CCMP3155]|uniref:Uncharacterized protein n=1 Tax=Vitrella brassicaformis (strain CCMP3155) TaxID=1169540 RepID=A0A0G4EM91_VITBC|nr:unnamed protein product [Vitrella brassicaformis CCMP3155]|eukprot:CEL98062.1 unnamed protein product [Vitrella brassicaformis CCMP3155]
MPSFVYEQQVVAYGAAPALFPPQPFHQHQHPQQHPFCMWPTPPRVPLRPIERHPAQKRCKPPARKPPRTQHTRGAPWRTRVNPYVCPPCLRARQDPYGATAAPTGAHAPPVMPAPPHMMQQHIRQPPPIAALGASAVHAPGWGFVPPAAALAPNRAPQTAAAPQRYATRVRPNIAAIPRAMPAVPAASNAREGEGREKDEEEREGEGREREGEEGEKDGCRTPPAISHQRQEDGEERERGEDEEEERAEKASPEPPCQQEEEVKEEQEGRTPPATTHQQQEERDDEGREGDVQERTSHTSQPPAASSTPAAPASPPQQEDTEERERERAEPQVDEEEERAEEAVSEPPREAEQGPNDEAAPAAAAAAPSSDLPVGESDETDLTSEGLIEAEAAAPPAPLPPAVPAAQPAHHTRHARLSAHTFGTDYWFNERTITLKVWVDGKAGLLKMRTPRVILEAMRLARPDIDSRVVDRIVHRALMAIEDEAQLLDRLTGQLRAPALLSRGHVAEADPIKVQLPPPNTSTRQGLTGDERVTMELAGPFYTAELLQYKGEEAPNLTQLTIARARITALPTTPTPAQLKAFAAAPGKDLSATVINAIAATERHITQEGLVSALEAIHDFGQPKKLVEVPPGASEEDHPPTRPYSPALHCAFKDNQPNVGSSTMLPRMWRAEGGELQLIHGDAHGGNLVMAGDVGRMTAYHIDHEATREVNYSDVDAVTNPRLDVVSPPPYRPYVYLAARAKNVPFAPTSSYTDVYGVTMSVALCALAGHRGFSKRFQGWGMGKPCEVERLIPADERLIPVDESLNAALLETIGKQDDTAHGRCGEEDKGRFPKKGRRAIERAHRRLFGEVLGAIEAEECEVAGDLVDLRIALECLKTIPQPPQPTEAPPPITLEPLIATLKQLIADAYPSA